MPLFFDKSSLINGKQIQQTHRFLLKIQGVDAALISKVEAPSYQTKTAQYTLLDYTFNFPVNPVWKSPISFDIIDVLDPDIFTTSLGFFMGKLHDSNYYLSPSGLAAGLNNQLDYSKQNLTAALGVMEILTLDEDGQIYDCWKLNNAMITQIKPADLTYDREDIAKLNVEVTYDWANYGFRGVYGEEGSLLTVLGRRAILGF